jgi:methyl-accepting chemotaxis protein
MRNLLSLTVRSRLILSFILILLVPSLTIGLTSYQTSKNKVDDQMTMASSASVQLLNATIDRFIEPEMQKIDFLADQLTSATYKSPNPTLQTGILAPFQEKNAEISSVYVGSTEGLFINAPAKKMPDGYDPRQRPWYQQAMEQKGKVIITSPYVSKTTGDFVISFAVNRINTKLSVKAA